MFERMLVAIDDSASTPYTLSYATAVAHAHDATVHLVYVNEFLVGGRGLTVLTATEAEALVRSTVAQLRADGVDATGSVIRSTCFNVANVIAEEAVVWDSDIILVGSRRRRGVLRLRGRSMRDRITCVTPLPVLAAPAPLQLHDELRLVPAEPGVRAAPLARR
jgi:nucleotide-binding universal stress UspA family protein